VPQAAAKEPVPPIEKAGATYLQRVAAVEAEPPTDSKGPCWDGAEKDGALCYTKCRDGYKGVGPVCWEKCPDGYKDDGATCRKPVVIEKRDSYGRTVGKPMGCGPDEEKDGGLCYPECKAGYKGVGPVCWERCPEGYEDDGLTCRRPGKIIKADSSACPWADKCGLTLKKGCSKCPDGYKNDGCTCRRNPDIVKKKSYGRGVGKPLHTCGADAEKDGALCYPKCKAGYDGVGPVCWASCKPGFKNDGATCRKPGDIDAKKSYGRGAGWLTRESYRNIFRRYIRDHYNMYKVSAKPLRDEEKTYLKRWFPASLVDKVQVLELAGMTGTFILTKSATTYGRDLIVVKKGNRSNRLLKHELVHTCQYDKLGRDGFAERYADQYVDSGYNYDAMTFEQDAFEFEKPPDAGTPTITTYAGKDGKRLDWYSTCK